VDPCAKTRWLLDHFVAVSQAIYNCECELIVDELIIPYKGRYCVISQFRRGKPIRFGIKVFYLASSKSRFVYSIEVFMGKGTGGGPGGLAMQVVLRLIDCLQGLWHTFVTDNFFTLVHLCHELLRRGFWSTSTVRLNRRCVPKALRRPRSKIHQGSILIKMHKHCQIVALSWQDKNVVSFLSTTSHAWQPALVQCGSYNTHKWQQKCAF
jgi:hypothetical protein